MLKSLTMLILAMLACIPLWERLADRCPPERR